MDLDYGISVVNKLYVVTAVLKVSVTEENGNMVHVTVRLYGPNTEYVINRDRELQVSNFDFLMLKFAYRNYK